jgi:hypothetical protein
VEVKNAVVSVRKIADDARVDQIGQQVSWTIAAGVGGEPSGSDASGTPATTAYAVSGYYVLDPISAALALNTGTVTGATGANADGVLSVRLANGGTPEQNVPLAYPADYTITRSATPPAGISATAGADKYLLLKFTPAGLRKLSGTPTAPVAPNGIVTVVLSTTVRQAGQISNTAAVFASQSAFARDSPTLSDPAETDFGGITLDKRGGTSNGPVIAGARFEVFAVPAGTPRSCTAGNAGDGALYLKPIAGVDYSAPIPGSYGIGTAGLDATGARLVWSTQADGKVQISGLRFSNFADGGTVLPGQPGYLQYCLQEIQPAPASVSRSYGLLPAPVPFEVSDVIDGQNDVTLLVVDPATTSGSGLPFTGVAGLTAMTTYGAALLAAGVLWLAEYRRRRALPALGCPTRAHGTVPLGGD